VPGGSVYWFEVERGDTADLAPLWENSLYAADEDLENEYRITKRREGFGRAWFGVWEPNN